jgi:hypothetical protein
MLSGKKFPEEHQLKPMEIPFVIDRGPPVELSGLFGGPADSI